MTADAAAELRARINIVATNFAADGLARGQRQALDRSDFAALAEAGFLRLGLPVAQGGHWRGLRESIRGYADIVATLAMGDPSVALVALMHPLVLCLWTAVDEVDSVESAAWARQREFVFDTVHSGHWWGTITSEPGSGGDLLRTRAVAVRAGVTSPVSSLANSFAVASVDAHDVLLTGEKHFGSGAGIASFMTSVARVAAISEATAPASAEPQALFVDMRDVPWDGTSGVTLVRAWDGHGMSATQSHAMRFESCPATLIAAPSSAQRARLVMGPLAAVLFSSVAVAIVRLAMRWSRQRAYRGEARSFESAEWVRCENTAWLIEQAYEGAIRATEADDLGAANLAALQAKLTIAALGEELLLRLGRVVGGSSFSRGQPLGQWAQDIRALGFLRPPWGLAAEQLTGMLRSRYENGLI